MRKQILSVNLTVYEIAGCEDHEFLTEPVDSIGRMEEAGAHPAYCMAQEGMLRTIRMVGATHARITRLGRAKSAAGHSFGGTADE